MQTPYMGTPFIDGLSNYQATPMSPLQPFNPSQIGGGGITSLSPNGHINFRPMSPYSEKHVASLQ